MAQVSGGELVVRALKAEGVKHIFTLVGDHILPICDASVDHGLPLIDTRHEAAAVHMADAWARVTGEPGVAMVTGGPGHSNAIPGTATAFLADSPVIFISGRPKLSRLGMGALQELDQVGMAAPITKGAWLVLEVQRIPEFVAMAFRVALTGRPGPVHLTIPIDVQEQYADPDAIPFYQPGEYRPMGRPQGDPALIQEALSLLAQAQRPVVIAGAAARFALSRQTLEDFIETTRLPLFTVELARGLVSDDHPLCFGYADGNLNEAAALFARADVVLLLGKKMDFRIGFGQPPALSPAARIIQVDPSPTEIGRNRGVAVGLCADIGAVVRQMAAAARGRAWPQLPWVEELRAARRAHQERLEAVAASQESPLHPLRVYRQAREFIDEEACLVFDGGDFVQWGRAYLRARQLGRWLRLGPLGHLGAGLPFALASKLAYPEAQVFLFIGDGSFGFYAMEFDTAVRHNLPIVAVIGNDAAWGIDRQFQLAYYGRDVGTELRLARYDKVVEALGGHGEFVEQPEQLGPALERALAAGVPAAVNVAIQRMRSPLAEAMIRQRAQGR